jgi:SH3 domain protein
MLLLALLLAVPASAQQLYVSDEVFIVLHAGPGTNYRWVSKLTPGTELVRRGESEDGEWSEVTTGRGTEGWVRSEFLVREPPAQARLPLLERRLEESERSTADLRSTLTREREEQSTLQTQLDDTRAQLQSVTEELAQLRQVSGSAVETAQQNRRLVTEAEAMRTTIDTLEADNQRLQERVRSSAFLDGAIAVGLGVIITLVVPRLWPRRRRSSSWA